MDLYSWEIGPREYHRFHQFHPKSKQTVQVCLTFKKQSGTLRLLTPKRRGWISIPLRGILIDVVGDRWLETFPVRGKSEHHRAVCLVKTRVPRM
jgi:hypothetical protein